MKASEIAEVTTAAFEQGFARGAKEATKAARNREKISHKMHDRVIQDAIVAVGGEELWDRIHTQMGAEKTRVTTGVMGQLDEMMESMGLGEEVAKLREALEKGNADGTARIRLFGFDPGAPEGEQTVEFKLGEEPVENQPADEPVLAGLRIPRDPSAPSH